MAKPQFMDEKAFREFISGEQENQDTSNIILRKQFTYDEVKMIDEDKLLVDFVISTESIDRMHDTISSDGWDLKNYKKNPVVLFAHDSREPPIAKASRLKKSDGKLTARAEFTPQDLYPFGHMIFQMYAKGFMKATSVGFRPLKYEYSEEDDRPYGIDFLKQELFEFSAVPVPANPEALIDVKAAGIDLAPLKGWAEKILDEWDEHEGLMIPKNIVEDIRKQSDIKSSKTYKVPKKLQDALLKANLEAVMEVANSKELKEIVDDEGSVVEDEKTIEDVPKNLNVENLIIEVDSKELRKTLDELKETLGTIKDTELKMENEEFEKLLSDLIGTADVLLDALETEKGLEVKSRKSRRLYSNTIESLKSLTQSLLEKSSVDEPENEKDIDDLPPEEESVKSLNNEEDEDEDEQVKDETPEYSNDAIAKAVGEVLPGIVQAAIDKTMGKV